MPSPHTSLSQMVVILDGKHNGAEWSWPSLVQTDGPSCPMENHPAASRPLHRDFSFHATSVPSLGSPQPLTPIAEAASQGPYLPLQQRSTACLGRGCQPWGAVSLPAPQPCPWQPGARACCSPTPDNYSSAVYIPSACGHRKEDWRTHST